jgi:hypothetical protein
MSIGREVPFATAPCVPVTTPRDVHPAGELPGPLATGPPRPDPTRVKTSMSKVAPATRFEAVERCVTVRSLAPAVKSKNSPGVPAVRPLLFDVFAMSVI